MQTIIIDEEFQSLLPKLDEETYKSLESGKNQHNEVDGQSDHQPQILSTAGFLAAKYKVSPRTIRRDAKVAEGINSIGEVSLAAKRSILAGEVSIDKKELERFSEKPREEIEAFVEAVENGEYGKKKAAASALARQAAPVDRALADLEKLGAAIAKAEANIRSELNLVPKKADRNALKKALKAHMDRLEERYALL
ncbi:MAG: hypothetical protein FWH33_00665 [Oscillospiraceae bacterium]|nr:hypothetical protein [Oscillospiraceae bacterium]